MSDENGWASDFRTLRVQIGSSVEALHELIAVIEESVGRNIDSKIHSSVTRLVELLDGSRRTSNELLDRFVERPVVGFLSGRALTREEYYMTLVAELHSYSAKAAGLSHFDDFEIFNFFHYEDEERRCCINPSMQPLRRNQLRVHGGGLGEPPEELSWSRLRPEQQDFFSDYLPGIASRFKRSV